jgi:pseudouridine-5'-phosphate glycosidase
VEEKQPVIAKAIRLTWEHITAKDSFHIPIPEDEPIQDLEVDYEMDQVEVESEPVKVKPKESLNYLISLMRDSGNRLNLQEIREYNRAMIEYGE